MRLTSILACGRQIRPSQVVTALAMLTTITMVFCTSASHGQTPITTGIDTYLTSAAKSGPDGFYGEETSWEFDGDDGGGFNQALLWFDISQDILDAFAAGNSPTAILKLHNVDSGSNGDMHRMTVDWLEGPDGGNFVTFNSIPEGPGIEPGFNAEEVANVSTGDMSSGTSYEFDVTTDVMAWANGDPNYGWGILPTGGGGNGVASFESTSDPPPVLELTGLFLTDADFNADGMVDLADFNVLASNFLTGTTFGEGDMNLDGTVNLQDFVDFRTVFSSEQAGAAVGVPEPQGLILMWLAGITFLHFRRRR